MGFLAQLSVPVVLYLQASALVTSSPNTIEDWRLHFYAIRRRFFGLNMVYGILILVVFVLPTGVDRPPIAVLAVCTVVVGLSAIAFRSDSHRVQSAVVLLLALLNVVTIATLIMEPQQFVSAG